MVNQQRITILAGIAAGVLLVAGVSHLFTLRFQAGDIYPPYSSLRSDPLGTKALFEGLAKCEGLTVSRNYQSLAKLDLPPDTTLLFLGDTVSFSPNEDYIPREIVSRLNSFMRRGGRVVITLQPRTWRPPDWEDHGEEDGDEVEDEGQTTEDRGRKSDGKAETAEKKEIAKDKPSGGNGAKKPAKIEHRKVRDDGDDIYDDMPLTNWLGTAFSMMSSKGPATATLAQGAISNLPLSVSCRTEMCFSNASPDWRVIYRRAGNDVMMERRLGRGSFVLSSLSFFASNEALRDERHVNLLAWLIGGSRNIVFDETHHQLFESPGIAWLMRKYRLQWLGLGLVVLAGLFIWRNTACLVPPQRAANAAREMEIAKGKDSTSGLINILRRNVSSGAVLGVCVKEWKRTLGRSDAGLERKIRQIDAIVERDRSAPVTKHDPAQAYNEICAVLKSKDLTTDDLVKHGRNQTKTKENHGLH